MQCLYFTDNKKTAHDRFYKTNMNKPLTEFTRVDEIMVLHNERHSDKRTQKGLVLSFEKLVHEMALYFILNYVLAHTQAFLIILIVLDM